jgi:hypothetical protein
LLLACSSADVFVIVGLLCGVQAELPPNEEELMTIIEQSMARENVTNYIRAACPPQIERLPCCCVCLTNLACTLPCFM